jgi:hypothetical protein
MVTSSTVLRFFSVDRKGNSETVRSVAYEETGQMARNNYYRAKNEWLVMAYTTYAAASGSYEVQVVILDAITKAPIAASLTSLAANPLMVTDAAGSADITFVYDEVSGTGYIVYYDKLGYEVFRAIPGILSDPYFENGQ